MPSSSPLLLIHICGAVLGLLSGYMAMLFRKGSGLHAAAGTVFFTAMIGMTTSAAYIATFLRPNMINVVAALLTLYLVATAWRAARHRSGGIGAFDRIALLWVVGVAVTAFISGFRAASMTTQARHCLPV